MKIDASGPEATATSRPRVARRGDWKTLLAWLLAIAPLVAIATDPAEFQWDLRLYQSAVQVYEHGLDPYDAAQRAAVLPAPGEFFYAPITLHAFRPVAWLPFPVMAVVWLVLKLVAVAILIAIWRRFEPLHGGYRTVLFFVFAFAGALYRDFAAGNIAIFEQVGLWAAFLLLLRRRFLMFGLLLAVVGQFKLTPLVFLTLLLVVESRPRWAELAVSAAAAAGLFALNFVLEPELMRSFLGRIAGGAGNLVEWGSINPSSLALIQNMTEILSRKGIALQPWADELLYAILVGVILAVVTAVLLRIRRRGTVIDTRDLIYAACFLFCLVAPRMKDYSYVVALLPALAIVRRALTRTRWPVEAIAVLAPVGPTYVPVIRWLPRLYGYLPLFTAGLLLAIHLKALARGPDAKGQTGGRAPVSHRGG